jgi:hypothetical protein
MTGGMIGDKVFNTDIVLSRRATIAAGLSAILCRLK